MAPRKKAATKRTGARRATPRGRAFVGQPTSVGGVFDHVRQPGVKHKKVYAMSATPAIHVGDERFPVREDRSIMVPSSMEKDFIKMGCTREPPAE